MADFALFRIRDRPIFCFAHAYQKLVLFSFALFLICGQFFRLVPLPYFPSYFSLAEIILYLLTLPIYFAKVRKSFVLLCAILISTLYGSFLHGIDWTSVFYAGKLVVMIIAGIVVGEIFQKRFSYEEGLLFLLKLFTWNLILGAVIFFVFPRAHLFFAFLDRFGVHFYGDPHQRRFISPFFDPNYYAAVACIPLILAWICRKNVLFLAILASIVLTFSRSGIVTCLMLLGLQRKKLPFVFLVGLLATLCFSQEIFHFFHRMIDLCSDESALARLDTFKTGLQFFWHHPFFGVGYHYLAPLFFLEFGRLAPDSSLLITLIDFGLIPTLLGLSYAVFWSVRQFGKLRAPYRILFFWLYTYTVICIIFTSQFNNLLYYQYWLIPVIVLFTFIDRIQYENCLRT